MTLALGLFAHDLATICVIGFVLSCSQMFAEVVIDSVHVFVDLGTLYLFHVPPRAMLLYLVLELKIPRLPLLVMCVTPLGTLALPPLSLRPRRQTLQSSRLVSCPIILVALIKDGNKYRKLKKWRLIWR